MTAESWGPETKWIAKLTQRRRELLIRCRRIASARVGNEPLGGRTRETNSQLKRAVQQDVTRREDLDLNTSNLFANAAPPPVGERAETLLTYKNLVIERIVSSATITSGEYVQSQDEWVVLVAGDAVVEVAGETLELQAGDYVFLPAGMPHSVRRVSEGALWLAVHLHSSQP